MPESIIFLFLRFKSFLKSFRHISLPLAGLFFLPAATVFGQTLIITAAPYNATTGSADNAAAIQAAINAVGSGGTVEVPAGNFLSGPVTLKSNMTFQLSAGATLQMTAMGTFPVNMDFIYGSKLSNITINGSGVMDGQGLAWWNYFNGGGTDNRPPAMIELTGCTGVTVSGISVINSPKFHVQFLGNGANILASGLTITAPWPSPNTDGIDLRGTNVTIQNCYISDGDDVIQIGGSNACMGITVQGCTFGTGHGLSIGSITSGGVSNVLVNNCVFNGTQYGLRLKSNNTEGGITSNVTYSNITMTNILVNPILMYSYYPDVPANPTTDTGSAANSTTPYWQNIKFENVSAAQTATGSANVGILWGLPQAPVSNVLFDACTITGSKIMDVFNTRGVTFDCNCLINGKAPSNSAAVTTYNAAMAGADNVLFAACGPTPTFTATSVLATPTRTATPLPTASATRTATPTATRTASPTASPTRTMTATATASATATRTATAPATPTLTATVLSTVSATPTRTATATSSATATASMTRTATLVFTRTSTPTLAMTSTPTMTRTSTPSLTATPLSTQTPTGTSTPSFTATKTATPAFTSTSTSTASNTSTPTATPTSTPTSVFTPTATPSRTATLIPTASASATASSTATPSATLTPIPTASFTDTPTNSFTPTLTLTVTPVPPTPTPSDTVTLTPVIVPTSTDTPTFGPGAPPISKPVPFPNPTQGGTVQIYFVLAAASSDVRIHVFTTAFRKVITADLGPLPAGASTPTLSLTDAQGRPLANGLYYVEVSDSQGHSIGKLMVLR